MEIGMPAPEAAGHREMNSVQSANRVSQQLGLKMEMHAKKLWPKARRGASGRTQSMLRVRNSCRGLLPKQPKRLPESQIFLVRAPHPYRRGKGRVVVTRGSTIKRVMPCQET